MQGYLQIIKKDGKIDNMGYDVNRINEDLKGWDGGDYFGQWETDKIIESYFPGQSEGFCVEIGAADGVKGSNTLYFEKLGWDVFCIEPNPRQLAKLEKHRKNILPLAVGNEEGFMDLTVFDVGKKNIMSSLTSLKPDKRLVAAHSHIINNSYNVSVEVKKLKNILIELNCPTKIDFISIDTEGTELDVLKSHNFKRYDVKLFIVENNYEDPEIEVIMKQKGYSKDQRYKINEFYIKTK